MHGSDVIDLMDAGHIVGIYPQQITMTRVEGTVTRSRKAAQRQRPKVDGPFLYGLWSHNGRDALLSLALGSETPT